MIYRTYRPHLGLAKFIKCYWSLESIDTALPASKERIFPDGCLELVFHFGDRFKKVKPDQTSGLQPRSFVHGQIKEFIELEATGKTGIFSVRFQPDGLRPFTRNSLQEITGENISLHDFWGKEGEILEDKILNASTHKQRILFLEHFLFQKLVRTTDNFSAINHCVHSIMRTNGSIGIDQLSVDLNLSRRHLERHFISCIGLTPKFLSRITRFQNTLRQLEQKQFNSLTAVAYESGFYDQAHFIRDFKKFTGLNPKQYFSRDLEMAKFLSSE